MLRFNPQALRAFRLLRGYSYGALAQRCGISKGQLWNMEKNAQQPRIGAAIEIARALEIELRLLVKEEPGQKGAKE